MILRLLVLAIIFLPTLLILLLELVSNMNRKKIDKLKYLINNLPAMVVKMLNEVLGKTNVEWPSERRAFFLLTQMPAKNFYKVSLNKNSHFVFRNEK
jgi:hypothetical protein